MTSRIGFPRLTGQPKNHPPGAFFWRRSREEALPRHKVLLVEDDAAIRSVFRDFLMAKGFVVHEADSSRSAQRLFQELRPDVTVADYELPDGTALEFLPRFKTIDPTSPVVIVTGHSSLELAVRAGKGGADQFLAKPVSLPNLHQALQDVLENPPFCDKDKDRGSEQDDPFLGDSAAIRKLRMVVERLLETRHAVLIQGETGTGKGVLARWIHARGARSMNAFVNVNCAGLSSELLDSELFGHERGAFTSASSRKTGLLEIADGGTVFLDEIGDLQLAIQGKLLKALEEQSFRRLGDVRDRHVDVRLIAASNRDLRSAVEEGRFRADLYYRIAVFPILVPALRERPEDVPSLAREILTRIASELGRPEVELTPGAIEALKAYAWPGNIRELKNVLERATLLTDGRLLDRSDLDLGPVRSPDASDDGCTLHALERRHIERILEDEHGHVARAAVRLGIPRSSLYQKLKRYGALPFER